MTEKQLSAVETEMHSAIRLEETALSEIAKRTGKGDDAAITALLHSKTALTGAKDMLRGHDLGGSDPSEDVSIAANGDFSASADLYNEGLPLEGSHGEALRAAAERTVKRALTAKRAALVMLLQVPTETQTGSTESLKGCAFEGNHNATSWTIDVKVSDPGEAGASGTVTIAGLVTPPLTGTFKLSSTGIAISQFTVTSIGDASITIDLSNLTTGQTQMLPFTFPLTTSTLPASDCTPQ